MARQQCAVHMFLCMVQMVNAVLMLPRKARGPAPPARLARCSTGSGAQDWTRSPALARRLGALLAARGEIAYWVVGCGRSRAASRGASAPPAREQTRLRSAKLLDAAHRFVCECRIRDRSKGGLRLRPRATSIAAAHGGAHDETGRGARRERSSGGRGSVIGVVCTNALLRRALKPTDRLRCRGTLLWRCSTERRAQA